MIHTISPEITTLHLDQPLESLIKQQGYDCPLRGSWQPVGPLATRAPKNHYLSEMLACYKARVKPEKKKGGRKTERER